MKTDCKGEKCYRTEQKGTYYDGTEHDKLT